MTSCDWSRANKAIIGVSSVDQTCSIWDLNKLEEKYMIIAHDKEVYDISLGQDEFIFMSTGADGSVRLFDSRQSNSSSIIFETRDESPMTRLKWNLVNPNFILTVIVDKNEIIILDQRKLSAPYGILKVHTNVVNNAIWAPQSNSNLISVSDDKSALLWDIYCDSLKPEEYIMRHLIYTCGFPEFLDSLADDINNHVFRRPVALHFSLNAVGKIRKMIMPVDKQYSYKQMLDCCIWSKDGNFIAFINHCVFISG